MSQYFDNDETLKSERHPVKYYVQERELTFTSDSGVFSKNAIDFGTRSLLNYVLANPLSGYGLDLGCGIGVIGITVALFKHVQMDLVDINKKAVELSKENIKNNGLDLEAWESNIFENVSKKDYDFILTNPPIRAGKNVVYAFFDGAFEHLKEGGYLLVVIQKKQGAPSAKKHLEMVFGNCEIVDRDKGYYLLKSVK